jgi:hypothetical protein
MAHPSKFRDTKSKHRVIDVCGNTGDHELLDAISETLLDSFDPSETLVIGGQVNNEAFNFFKRLSEHLKWWGAKEKIGKFVRAATTVTPVLDFDDKPIAPSFASREHALGLVKLINSDSRIRNIIVLDGQEEYLSLLDSIAKPLSVYVNILDDRRGLFVRGEMESGKLFDTKEDFEKAGDLKWLVEGLMYQQEVTGWAGLQKNGKSWILMSLMKALLSGQHWLGKYAVAQSAKVVYFVPEVGRSSVYRRMKKLGLDQYLGQKLFVRSASLGVPNLENQEVLAECAGADVFLDTLIRFIDGPENAAEVIKELAAKIFKVQAIARSVNVAAHTQKSYAKAEDIGPDMFRGSGDVTAFMSNGYGVMQLDEPSNRIYVKGLFGRDLPELAEAFIIEGRPHIDATGDFKLVDESAGPMRDHKNSGGSKLSKLSAEQIALLRDCRAKGMTARATALVPELKIKSHNTVTEYWKLLDEQSGNLF